MPRPRKDRLIPSITTYTEELLRTIAGLVRREVTIGTTMLQAQIKDVQRDLQRLERVASRPGRAPAARGKGGRPPSHKTCTVGTCKEPHVARGLCKNHYQAARYAEKMRGEGKTVQRRISGPEPIPEGPGRARGKGAAA